MSDTKTILEKRIEERAENRINSEINKAIDSLPYWIRNLRCVKNKGGDEKSIEDFLIGVGNKSFSVFPFPKVEEVREGKKQEYIREETDKFLKQIDLVAQITNEVQQQRQEISLDDVPF